MNLFSRLLPVVLLIASNDLSYADQSPAPTSSATPSVPEGTSNTLVTGSNLPTTMQAPGQSATPLTIQSTTSLSPRIIKDIRAKIMLPPEWTLLSGKLLEGEVLLATREKITGENDPYLTGLSMTVDKTGAKESSQKASIYAMGLAREAREKAGEEGSPIVEKHEGAFTEIRFEFPVAGDQLLLVTEVLRANDATGTVTTIVWQMPKEEDGKLRDLREEILSGLALDPSL